MVKRMIRSEVKCVRLKGRPWLGWMNNMNRVLNEREMFVDPGSIIVHD